MADTYDIDEYDIRKMLLEEIADLVDTKLEEKQYIIDDKYIEKEKELEEMKELEDYKHIEKEAELTVYYNNEVKEIIPSIGKEIDSTFTGTTEDELIGFILDKKMKLFDTHSGRISLCNQFIKNHMNLKEGDAVQIGGRGYRNENLMFWSKTKGLVYPDYDMNDYGTVPSDFQVGEGEFAPWHWTSLEYYDGIIWLSDTLREQILSSLKEVPSASLSKEITDLLLYTNSSKISTMFCTEVLLHDELVQVISGVPLPKYFVTVAKTVIEGYE